MELVKFLLRKCWEDVDVRNLLRKLMNSEMPQEELCNILEEIAAYCLGESDDLPSVI
jgi:CCR4-NOT transcriptional regulation complex NOT5 subunit